MSRAESILVKEAKVKPVVTPEMAADLPQAKLTEWRVNRDGSPFKPGQRFASKAISPAGPVDAFKTVAMPGVASKRLNSHPEIGRALRWSRFVQGMPGQWDDRLLAEHIDGKYGTEELPNPSDLLGQINAKDWQHARKGGVDEANKFIKQQLGVNGNQQARKTVLESQGINGELNPTKWDWKGMFERSKGFLGRAGSIVAGGLKSIGQPKAKPVDPLPTGSSLAATPAMSPAAAPKAVNAAPAPVIQKPVEVASLPGVDTTTAGVTGRKLDNASSVV